MSQTMISRRRSLKDNSLCKNEFLNQNFVGDFLIPLEEGAFGIEHAQAELADLVTGRKQGRTSSKEITLFKSLGIALEDMACAQFLYEKCKRENRGKWIEFN